MYAYNFVFALLVILDRTSAAAVTENPALRGVTFVGPAPWYECTTNGAYPHEEKCEQFYDCWNGVATLGLCTEVQLFDLSYNGCNWAEQVDCGTRTRPPGYPLPPVECPAPSGYFPHPHDCRAFIVCENNIAYDNCCQPGLYYNSALPVPACDYPANVQCGDRPVPPGSCVAS